VDGAGRGHLEYLGIEDSTSGKSETVPAAALFVLIGAEPHTGWLGEDILRDERGFILTGHDLQQDVNLLRGWFPEGAPMPLETSVPGVFAVGDVRHGPVKRVASAVGEGSIAVQMVHRHVGETPQA
jgi:thioredoxin reductase (NADPH)